MTVADLRASKRAGRRAGTLLLSVTLHGLLLGALALRLPAVAPVGGLAAPDIDVVPATALVRVSTAAPAPKTPAATRSRAIVSAAAPRYAGPPQAQTGEASDAVDLFGPVFADGQWPRPLVVKSEPCDPHEATPKGDDCRRELLLIGLAPGGAAGADSRP